MERHTVFLIEPDAAAARALATLLKPRYSVTSAPSAATARTWLRGGMPDLIVLELALPDTDGLVFCAELRARGRAGLLIHSWCASQRERLLTLRLGADDFVPKPADPAELEARIDALLRRIFPKPGRATLLRSASPAVPAQAGPSVGVQRIGDLMIDRERMIAKANDRPLYLTHTEFRLLSFFARRLGQPLSRNDLAQTTGGYEHIAGTRSLDMHVRRLRLKLSGAPGRIPVIVAMRGLGYRMMEPAERMDPMAHSFPAA